MTPTEPELQDRLRALQASGAPVCAPLRWLQAQALHARLPGCAPDLRSHLAARLGALLDACERQLAQGSPPMPRAAQTQAAAGSTGLQELAALNASLRAHRAQLAREASSDDEVADPAELVSLRRFRHSWARMAVQDRVTAAISRAPDNAGPLNSHALVLRSLALMRELSPDYLRRFMVQLDTLLWLEDSLPRAKKAETPAGRRTRNRG